MDISILICLFFFYLLTFFTIYFSIYIKLINIIADI